ncbi:MAG: class I SAM-dependent RNA methyltransferase, partial [Deltaproteobacteria bacterium]
MSDHAPATSDSAITPGRVLSLHPDGDARGELDGGEPVRVHGGVPGDVGELAVVHRGKNATWTRVHALSTPSPDRVTPPCALVESCGGCPWQMIAADAQRTARVSFLREALGDVLGEATVHPTVTSPTDVGYRTRAMMMLRHVGGALQLGFYAPRTNDLVAVDACPVQDPRLDRALLAARDVIAETDLASWRGADRPGHVRALAMKLDPTTGDGLLTIVATRDDPRFDRLAPALQAIQGVAGVHLCRNDAPGGQLLRGSVRRLSGASRLTLHLGPVTVQVGPLAFVQTHHAIAVAMIETVLGLAPERVAHVADLYAGVGVFGLALRDRADAVTLVEASPDAIRDARANASRLPGVDHVTVVEGDAGEEAAKVLRGGPDELVVLDPPRAGCRPPVLAAVAAK